MAIRKKHRRKITVGDRRFLWWVHEIEPEDWTLPVLTVASEDKRFVVRYYLGQYDERHYLVVLGTEFPGLPDAGGRWQRLDCPTWETDSTIRPANVRALITWCFSNDRPLVHLHE